MEPVETLEKILATVESLATKQTEESHANIAKQLKDSLKQLDAEWKMTRDASQKQKDEAEAKMTELYAQIEKMNKSFSEAQTKLYEMEENSRATKRLIAYNARMEAMEASYDMDDDDRKIVAAKLKDLDEKDETFAAFQEEFAKLWKHKNKEFIAKAKEEAKKKVEEEVAAKLAELSKAGEIKAGEEKKTTENALDNAKASQESVINNNQEISKSETLVDRWKKSFDPKKSITFSK